MPPRPAEARAARLRLHLTLVGILDRAQEQMLAAARRIAHRIDAVGDDPPPTDFDARDLATLESAFEQATDFSEPALRAAVRRIGVEVRDLSHRDMERVLGIPLTEGEFGELMNGFVRQNATLIRTLTQKQVRDVMTIVRSEVPRGLRMEQLATELEERFGVARRHAALIARTETAKLKSQVDEERQRQVGVMHYVWRAVGGETGDGRTREMHKALHGRRISYDEPPEAEENGERHHPGRFPNCRCYAEPDLAGLL